MISAAKHFIVMGAGAVGCYLGARLIAHGQSVSLVGRPRTIDPIRAGGLRVTDLDGFDATIASAQIQAYDDFTSAFSAVESNRIEPNNLVILLCVKGNATVKAALEVEATVSANFGSKLGTKFGTKLGTKRDPNEPLNAAAPGQTFTPYVCSVISMQNGVENVKRIQDNAPNLTALAGMVPYNVGMRSANHVHRGVNGMLAMQRSLATEQIAPIFDAAGLPCRLHDNMINVQWGKLLLNLNNPVNAISNLPLLYELKDWHFRRVFAALQLEALAVLKTANITPIKAGMVDPAVLPRLLQLPNFVFERIAAKLLKIDPTARSSMWDDVQRANTTEVDDLCGAVVRLASTHGLDAPLNRLMCTLLSQLKKGDQMSGVQLWQQIKLAQR